LPSLPTTIMICRLLWISMWRKWRVPVHGRGVTESRNRCLVTGPAMPSRVTRIQPWNAITAWVVR
jgi:hypothetical protein